MWRTWRVRFLETSESRAGALLLLLLDRLFVSPTFMCIIVGDWPSLRTRGWHLAWSNWLRACTATSSRREDSEGLQVPEWKELYLSMIFLVWVRAVVVQNACMCWESREDLCYLFFTSQLLKPSEVASRPINQWASCMSATRSGHHSNLFVHLCRRPHYKLCILQILLYLRYGTDHNVSGTRLLEPSGITWTPMVPRDLTRGRFP